MKRTTRNKKNIDLSLVIFIHVHLFLISLSLSLYIYIHTFIHFLSDFMVTFWSPQLEVHWTFLRGHFFRPSHARRRVLAQLLLTEEPKLQKLRWHRKNWWMRVSSMLPFSKERCLYNVHPGFLKLRPHFIGHFDLCYWGRFIILTQQIDWLLLPIWNRQGCTNNH